MPAWEIDAFGHSIPMSVLIPALVIPGLIFTAIAIYPFLERWATGDYEIHHTLDRPRDVPARMGLGMAGVTFYGLLWLAGGNDIIAKTFNIPLFTTTWIFRCAVILGPVIAFVVARRIALGLQRRDRELAEHGLETGIIVRAPSGEYTERTRPLDEDESVEVRSRKLPRELERPVADEEGVEPKEARRPTARLRYRLNRLYTEDVIPPPNGEHEEAPEERPAIEP